MTAMRRRGRLEAEAQLAVAAVTSLALAACAVGPNYQRPEATTVPAAYANPSEEWKVATPRDHVPKGSWWKVFADAELDLLEADAATANQELKAAAARFEQARAVTDVARSVDLGGAQPLEITLPPYPDG
jgi:multidrug efflux system outer membrane protein